MQKRYSMVLFCLFLLAACQTKQSTDTTTATANPPATATPPPSKDAGKAYEPSPMPKLAAVLQECNKVEFQLYDYGISFETLQASEVMAYFQYIENKRADESSCKPGRYDGAAVFKNKKGDIALAMEINVIQPCNRSVFSLDGQQYTCQFTPSGLAFFQQIINRRQSVLEGAQGGAPPAGH